MNRLCKYKLYFIAVFIGLLFAASITAVNYFNFLREPGLFIDYEYGASLRMLKKSPKNTVAGYRVKLTKYYMDKKIKNWASVSKELLLLYPIDRSLLSSRRLGSYAYKNVKFDGKIINELKTVYGR
ncbi:MAG: hypothetical protein ACYCSB_06970 [bacterium]